MKKKKRYDVNDVNSAEIPEFVYESLARSLLPVIQKYYINELGGLPCPAVLPVLRLPICDFLDINKKSEPISDWIKVRIISLWWTRGESNPCPKTDPYSLLRAHLVFLNSPFRTPASRLTERVAFFFMTASKANRLCTFTAK